MAAPNERQFQPLPVPIGNARAIAAPFQFVTTGEDNLRVTVVNSLIGCRVAIQGRRIDQDGAVLPIAFSFTPTSDRIASSQIFPLGVGAIVNLAVWASSGTPRIGQTFVIVQLVRGREGGIELLGTLLQGYVTSTQGLGWPGSPIESSITGPGFIRNIQATTPAPSNQIAEYVPTGARWELLGFTAIFVSDASVIVRTPMLFADAGYGQIFFGLTNLAFGASEVHAINWSSGYGGPPLTQYPFTVCPIAASMPLLAGAVIQTSVLGMTAGDTWTQPHFTVREWLEVP
jgi:hypothetical protein